MSDTPPSSGESGFSLFDEEERVLEQTKTMLHMLETVADGVRGLAQAYGKSYREQRRLVRLSDRMQLDLQTANQRLEDQAGELKTLNLALAAEVEQRKALAEEVHRMAITDPLTSMFTRRHLYELGERELKRSARHGLPLALLLIDVDHLKMVNDAFGLAVGDEVLRGLAGACARIFRESDIAGRLGGEEFCALLPDTGLDEARGLADGLRAEAEAMRIPLADGAARFTVSIGLIAFDGGAPSLDRLLQRADMALYQAKAAGCNTVMSLA
jgi:diguanylate cyclase (GGDEF)-like protein